MTQWKEDLDRLIQLDDAGETLFSLLDVQDFIEELIEQIINEIPDLYGAIDNINEPPGKWLKVKLRKKYLN